MSEQMLIYFINFLFIYSISKGFFRGGTSELISIGFFIIGILLAIQIFQNTFYRTVISIGLFFAIYTLGLFIAYFFQSKSPFERLTGAFFGIIKFFVFLTTVTTLALLMESIPLMYKNNFFVSWIYEPAVYFQKSIIEKKQSQGDSHISQIKLQYPRSACSSEG